MSNNDGPSKTSGCVFGCLLVALMFYAGGKMLIGLARMGDRAQNEPSAPGEGPGPVVRDSTDVWVMAQMFVEDRLLAPSTASFGKLLKGEYQDPDDCVRAQGDGLYLVSGWVDSQNGFGAMIRQRFACELQYEGTKCNCNALLFESDLE